MTFFFFYQIKPALLFLSNKDRNHELFLLYIDLQYLIIGVNTFQQANQSLQIQEETLFGLLISKFLKYEQGVISVIGFTSSSSSFSSILRAILQACLKRAPFHKTYRTYEDFTVRSGRSSLNFTQQ